MTLTQVLLTLWSAVFASNSDQNLPPNRFVVAPGPNKYQISAAIEGIPGPYTPQIKRIIENLIVSSKTGVMPTITGLNDDQFFKIKCYETAGKRFAVGAQQFILINASMAKVELVLDDIGSYKELFGDFKDIHVISNEGNKYLTFWEEHIPLFFVPNVRYQMTYVIDKSAPSYRIYRYQLSQSKDIHSSDGFIYVRQLTPSKTLYIEYDFVDANWGALESLAPSRIWKESILGLYQSDLAIKMKAEHQDWENEKVREESEKAMNKDLVETCIAQKKALELSDALSHR